MIITVAFMITGAVVINKAKRTGEITEKYYISFIDIFYRFV